MSAGIRRYIIRRVLVGIPMVFLLISIVFVVMHVLPGDPILVLMGERITEKQYLELKEEWGLNAPLYIQYANYLTGVFRGDLGLSVATRNPVSAEILRALPATLEVIVAATIISLIVGFPLGLISALKKHKLPDFVIRFVSLGGFSIPAFWVGLMLQLLVAIYLTGLLPMAGRIDPRLSTTTITGFYVIDSILTLNPAALVDSLKHLILPGLTLATFHAALMNRIVRSNLIEVLDQDYIQTARAKGLTEVQVLSKHAFWNAIIPIITVSGMNFARQLGGVILTETVFSIPGMGSLLMLAVSTRDFALIQGVVLVFGLLVIVVSSILDILYAYLDPRIRIG